MNSEREFSPLSGYLAFLALLLVVCLCALVFLHPSARESPITAVLLALLVILAFKGFCFVNPNDSCVLTLFGKYSGTIKKNGFFWVNPFFVRQRISLRARNFDSERLKVNDQLGNPILISVILVWRVKDTFKATFEVDFYEKFVQVQTDAAVRKLASQYPYDNFEDEKNEITLRSGVDTVNEALERELLERLHIAGIEILEARIGYLAYAEEIANAMLRRQQATAIIAARHKIVEGAVSMVEMALAELNKKDIVKLDEERKANMVSNLMVVLCSDKETTPVVNAGG